METFLAEIRALPRRLPGLWPFLAALTCWLALFHFFGNATFGYVKTPSLYGWMYEAYTSSSRDDGHGLLIPFVVLGLLWWKREEWLSAEKRPWPAGLAAVAAATALHILGYAVQLPRISIAALFLGGYGLALTMWGPRFARRILFPYALFVFCIPMSALAEPITVPLRMLSTNIAAFVARDVLGVPIVQVGVQMFNPNGAYSYEVAAACSGIRSMIALSALTAIFAMVYFRKPWKRLVVISLAIPLALTANVARLIAIIVAAEALGEEAGMFVHNWFGFVTFAGAIAALIWIERLWREPERSPESGGGKGG